MDIPFAGNEIDAVIANMMLYHVPDVPKGLGGVRRVLKDNGTFYCAAYGENGMMEHIRGMFSEYCTENRANGSFTLQNGAEKLAPFFSGIERYMYEDSLAVTDVEDMADYIYSLGGMTGIKELPRETVLSVLERNMTDGVLRIPKEYSMFTAR